MEWAAGMGRDSCGKLCVIWQDQEGRVDLGSIGNARLPVAVSS